jgi:hypothetical protein
MPTTTKQRQGAVSRVARERRARFLGELTREHAAFEALVKGGVREISDFTHKRRPEARAVALRKLQARFDRLALFIGALNERKQPPLALWMILRPRPPVLVDPEHPRDAQDCCTIDYLAIGKLPDGRSMSANGFAGIEITSHTLARLLDESRSPLGMTCREAIWTLYINSLRLSAKVVGAQLKKGYEFLLVDVGDGAFSVQLSIGPDVSLPGEPFSFRICAQSFWASHLKYDRSRLLPEATCNDDMLGLGHLLPSIFRKIDQDGSVTVFEPARALFRNSG